MYPGRIRRGRRRRRPTPSRGGAGLRDRRDRSWTTRLRALWGTTTRPSWTTSVGYLSRHATIGRATLTTRTRSAMKPFSLLRATGGAAPLTPFPPFPPLPWIPSFPRLPAFPAPLSAELCVSVRFPTSWSRGHTPAVGQRRESALTNILTTGTRPSVRPVENLIQNHLETILFLLVHIFTSTPNRAKEKHMRGRRAAGAWCLACAACVACCVARGV